MINKLLYNNNLYTASGSFYSFGSVYSNSRGQATGESLTEEITDNDGSILLDNDGAQIINNTI